jgi:transcriptional regulator with XRE-family HTH domain
MPGKLKKTPAIVSPDSQELGKRIAAIRKKRGITQVQLAQIIGIGQTLISSYEVGRISLSAEMLFRLAKALKVSADEILGVGNGKSELDGPSLKIVKRLKKIERLPPGRQKALLTNIDMFLKAAESG